MPIGGFISDLLGPSISTYITPALEGAATGALGSVLQGKNPLTGALVGGGTGLGIGAFGGADGALAQALGLSGPQVNALIGGAGGALGYGLTGQNPLIGGALGAAGGYMYPGGGDGKVYDTAGNLVTGGPNAPAGTDAGLIDKNGNSIVPPDANASAATTTASGGGGGPQGAISSSILGKGDGLGGISKTQLLLGALAALGAATSKPKQGTWTTPGPESNAANLGPTFNAPLNTNVSGRTAQNPFATPAPSYWTYGGPEKTYFSGNSLKSYGFAEGGAMAAGMNDDAPDDGDGEFSTDSHGNYVQGPGDGQSDDIPARLADGEYVLTAMDVARIGQGSNQAGAKKLDRFREDLAKSSKQDQFIPHGQEKHLGGLMEGVR